MACRKQKRALNLFQKSLRLVLRPSGGINRAEMLQFASKGTQIDKQVCTRLTGQKRALICFKGP